MASVHCMQWLGDAIGVYRQNMPGCIISGDVTMMHAQQFPISMELLPTDHMSFDSHLLAPGTDVFYLRGTTNKRVPANWALIVRAGLCANPILVVWPFPAICGLPAGPLALPHHTHRFSHGRERYGPICMSSKMAPLAGGWGSCNHHYPTDEVFGVEETVVACESLRPPCPCLPSRNGVDCTKALHPVTRTVRMLWCAVRCSTFIGLLSVTFASPQPPGRRKPIFLGPYVFGGLFRIRSFMSSSMSLLVDASCEAADESKGILCLQYGHHYAPHLLHSEFLHIRIIANNSILQRHFIMSCSLHFALLLCVYLDAESPN